MTTHYAEDKLARAQALGYQDYLFVIFEIK